MTKRENISISKTTVCDYLKKRGIKTKKIKKSFLFKKKKRVEFCKIILEKKINGEEIIFTGETVIKLGGKKII